MSVPKMEYQGKEASFQGSKTPHNNVCGFSQIGMPHAFKPNRTDCVLRGTRWGERGVTHDELSLIA